MGRYCTIWIAVFACLFFGTNLWAQKNLESEYQAIRKSDSYANREETFPRYKAIAEKGHVYSQYVVGERYWWGRGVEKSKSEARRWYVKAANNGSVHAAYKLGEIYEKGDSVPKSSAEEFKWYMKAAELGHADAMSNIGGMYYRGDGVPRSMTSAAYWFKKSSDAGGGVGKMALASMQKDHPEAVRNMSRGSTAFGPSGPAGIRAVRPAPVKQPQLTPASQGFDALEKGQYARARTILLPHANKGNGDAQNVMGILYLDGLGVAKSNQRAESWFRKAANKGHAAGQYHLGAMIYYRRAAGGVDPYGTAKSLLEKSAAQGSDQARTLLAQMEEDDRQRRVREWKDYRDSIDDIQLGRCRNPRYVKVRGREKMLCD